MAKLEIVRIPADFGLGTPAHTRALMHHIARVECDRSLLTLMALSADKIIEHGSELLASFKGLLEREKDDGRHGEQFLYAQGDLAVYYVDHRLVDDGDVLQALIAVYLMVGDESVPHCVLVDWDAPLYQWQFVVEAENMVAAVVNRTPGASVSDITISAVAALYATEAE
jgi:hypothetical protein